MVLLVFFFLSLYITSKLVTLYKQKEYFLLNDYCDIVALLFCFDRPWLKTHVKPITE